MSVPLVKGDRVRTGLRGWQGLWYVVQVCFEGCYVCENVGEGSVVFGGIFWKELWGGLQT